MPGDNAVFSADGYGTKTCKVERVAHGINIVADEDQSRNNRAFYPKKRTSGSFGLTLIFRTRRERDDFAAWMHYYVAVISDPHRTGIGPLRVRIAAVNFDKTAIPTGGQPVAEYGDRFDSVAYRLELAFEGAKDPVEYNSTVVSHFIDATRDVTGTDGSFYFYPPYLPLSDDDIIHGKTLGPNGATTLVPPGVGTVPVSNLGALMGGG